MRSFQSLILDLQRFWAAQGCVILQPYDVEVGAGTFHPATALRALGPEPWRAAYVQPSRRPTDGRYGDNPNRLQHYYQLQVILKPAPVRQPGALSEQPRRHRHRRGEHDIRFVEDDWESPTLGASGLGWEVWLDGMEVSAIHLFPAGRRHRLRSRLDRADLRARAAGDVRAGEGEHLRPRLQRRRGPGRITYADVFKRAEREFSAYNFEHADTGRCSAHFADAEAECQALVGHGLALPAYDQCLKASHLFNLLDARGVVSVTERAAYIGRVRALARACCEAWLAGAER